MHALLFRPLSCSKGYNPMMLISSTVYGMVIQIVLRCLCVRVCVRERTHTLILAPSLFPFLKSPSAKNFVRQQEFKR